MTSHHSAGKIPDRLAAFALAGAGAIMSFAGECQQAPPPQGSDGGNLLLDCSGVRRMGPETIVPGASTPVENFYKITGSLLQIWSPERQEWVDWKSGAEVTPLSITWQSDSGMKQGQISRSSGMWEFHVRKHAPDDGHVYVLYDEEGNCKPGIGPQARQSF